MKKLNIIFFALMTIVFASCQRVIGDGPVETETRDVKGFEGVDLRCSANVYFTQAPDYKVEVHAQRSILDVLITEVSDGKLVIRYKRDVLVGRHDRIEVIVSGPDAKRFRISGSGDIKTTTAVTAPSLDLDISGSGTMDISSVETDYLDANISGSGNITVHGGTAKEEKLKISGSGDLYLEDLTADVVTTTTSGSGNTRVHAVNTLDVTISGSGSVYYKGSPIINTHTSGSGKVVHM